MSPAFWTMISFCLLCMLAGVALVAFGPRLFHAGRAPWRRPEGALGTARVSEAGNRPVPAISEGRLSSAGRAPHS